MPRQVRPLTEKQISAFIAKARAGTLRHPTTGEPLKAPKLFDGGGLFLTVSPVGTAAWRIKYRFDGDERTFSLGVKSDELTLEKARAEREWVRAHLKAGRDPIQVQRTAKVANVMAALTSFSDVCADWLALRKKGWSESHYKTTAQAIKRDLLPALGKLPISDITAPMLATVLAAVNGRSESTAEKLLWSLKGVFELAQVQQGAAIRENPALPLRAILTKATPKKKRPALLEFAALGELLRRIDVAQISPTARMAHRLVAFTAQRSANLVAARWAHFDLDSELPSWTLPRNEMKVKKREHDHRVLLSPTITAELRRWQSIAPVSAFVFQSPHRTKQSHLSAEALEHFFSMTLAEDLRGKHSVHGWRSSLSTLAKDAGMDRDAVDLTLDHVHSSEVARAYDRGNRLDQRIALVHWWDAHLTAAQHGDRVIAIHATGTA